MFYNYIYVYITFWFCVFYIMFSAVNFQPAVGKTPTVVPVECAYLNSLRVTESRNALMETTRRLW